jgi:hypothetical protein
LSGDVGRLLVPLEVQSQRDADVARPMFSHLDRIRDNEATHVISLAVLGDAEANSRPNWHKKTDLGCQKN